MKNLFTLCLFICGLLSQAQDNPVSWKATYKATTAGEGEIVVTADIQNGWHIYSIRPTDAGPIPTSFTFSPSQYKLLGAPAEINVHEEFDQAFGAKIFAFTDKAEFRQKIKVTKPGTSKLQVEYMSCNDMMCLPPKTVELTVQIQ